MRIAVIGSGIAGLGAAWLLHQRHDIVLYEAAAQLGGHSHTVDIRWRGRDLPVDTGFIVYNERNYPNLSRLFRHLGVPTQPSDMSFGVSIDGGRVEYAGTSLGMLFAQRRNLVRPGFHRMLVDILRFNAMALRFLADQTAGDRSLGDFLAAGRFSSAFRDYYLLPMGAAIWSSTLAGMEQFPARSFLQFFANHGLLSLDDRPQWRTVTGGAVRYVERLSAPFADRIRLSSKVRCVRRWQDQIEILDEQGGRDFVDQVVLACHADQALAMIDRPTAAEQAVLGAFQYQPNRVILHRDPAMMPKRHAVWSSWNYLARRGRTADRAVSVTYWLNRLQRIEPDCPAFVSLNPLQEPDPACVIAEFSYDHPQFTAASIGAQARLPEIQGHDRLWFCGAHWGYGFHEDGLLSGLRVAAAFGVTPPLWNNVTPLHPVLLERYPAAVAAGGA